MKKTTKYATFCLAIAVLAFCVPTTLLAGPNADAACGLDLNPETRNYSKEVSDTDMDSAAQAQKDGMIAVAVVAQGVADLDTYQVEVRFDPQVLEFVAGSQGDPVMDYANFLESEGGAAMGFRAVKTEEGVVNVSNALIGSDPGQAPEGSGIIAVLHFKILEEKPAELNLQNVFFLDSAQETDAVLQLSGAVVN